MEEEKTLQEKQDEEENAFLNSLEKLSREGEDGAESEGDNPSTQDKTDEEKKAEEEQRQKNKNAEEARKRREAEAKAKKEAEKQEKSQSDMADAQGQVKALMGKYPDLDLNELDHNEDFQDYIEGKWYKGGKTITELYERFVKLEAKLSKEEETQVFAKHKKKSTPSLKGNGGTSGGDKNIEVYSKEELEALSLKIPTMRAKDFAKIEEKLNRSISFYKKK